MPAPIQMAIVLDTQEDAEALARACWADVFRATSDILTDDARRSLACAAWQAYVAGAVMATRRDDVSEALRLNAEANRISGLAHALFGWKIES